jgi:DNA-binding MarR family transcriptional regulator
MEWLDDIARGWATEYPELDLNHLPPLVRLARLGVLIEAFQHDVLQPFGLSPTDYGVLASLRRAGPPYALNPSQLYSLLRRSSGGMTKILKRLEQAGLVERTPDPEDGRGSRVMLTARGRSLQDRVFRAFVRATRGLLAPLSPEHLEGVDAGLKELLETFEIQAGGRGRRAAS